jgi:hypothetical protein
VSEKRHIGEILLMQETVDAWVLTQTLKAHAAGSQRLVSVLVARAQLDPDDGAMALSEQLGYPAALQRHLERRDPACQELIPRELVQRWVVLPLGRARDNTLVVVARDPTPILAAALAHATKQSITLAVTPELHLDKLIRSIYGFAPAATATNGAPPTLGEIGISLDADPSAPVHRRARTVSAMFNDGTPELPHRAPQGTDRVDRTLVDIDNAITVAAAERFAFAYAARRWRSALLLDVAEGAAIGRRGQGPRLHSVEAIVLPLATPSLIQVAHDQATATTSAPSSVVQLRLAHLLEDATTPAAAAIVVAGAVRAVLVVGDPVHSGPRESVADLARLADAIGAAYDRFSRR